MAYNDIMSSQQEYQRCIHSIISLYKPAQGASSVEQNFYSKLTGEHIKAKESFVSDLTCVAVGVRAYFSRQSGAPETQSMTELIRVVSTKLNILTTLNYILINGKPILEGSLGYSAVPSKISVCNDMAMYASDTNTRPNKVTFAQLEDSTKYTGKRERARVVCALKTKGSISCQLETAHQRFRAAALKLRSAWEEGSGVTEH